MRVDPVFMIALVATVAMLLMLGGCKEEDDSYVVIDDQLYLTWELPTARENGDYLSPEEIQNVIVYEGDYDLWLDYTATSYPCERGLWYSVAVVDTDGLYSEKGGPVHCND